MTALTGTRLLERLGLIDSPLRRVRTSQGDVLRLLRRRPPRGESIGYYRMTPAAPFEVDGIRYTIDNVHGIRFFTIKDAVDCWTAPHDNDRCQCVPFEYTPLSYRHGEIDEEAWLRDGQVVGKRSLR